jgi:rhodanese-related sulfurtransferase
MRKKYTLLTLVIAFALVISGFQTVFAGYKPFETKIENEVEAEEVAMNLYRETVAGGYDLVDTRELRTWMESGDDFILVDTMPAGSYGKRHLSKAVNFYAPMTLAGLDPNSDSYDPDADNFAKDILAYVEEQSGTTEKTVKTKQKVTKTTRYYWNSYSKKWVTKKPKAKYYKACTKKKDKHYKKKTWTKTTTTYVTKTKKVTVPNKDKMIVVYCGYTKCTRSDVGAAFLVSEGYTNVYRYPGGISGWYDAYQGELMEGTNITPEE